MGSKPSKDHEGEKAKGKKKGSQAGKEKVGGGEKAEAAPTPAVSAGQEGGATGGEGASTTKEGGAPADAGQPPEDVVARLNQASGLVKEYFSMGREKALKELFSILDLDGNGTIERPELQGALGEAGADEDTIDDIFDAIDVSGDNKITYEEFSNGMLSLASQPGLFSNDGDFFSMLSSFSVFAKQRAQMRSEMNLIIKVQMAIRRWYQAKKRQGLFKPAEDKKKAALQLKLVEEGSALLKAGTSIIVHSPDRSMSLHTSADGEARMGKTGGVVFSIHPAPSSGGSDCCEDTTSIKLTASNNRVLTTLGGNVAVMGESRHVKDSVIRLHKYIGNEKKEGQEEDVFAIEFVGVGYLSMSKKAMVVSGYDEGGMGWDEYGGGYSQAEVHNVNIADYFNSNTCLFDVDFLQPSHSLYGKEFSIKSMEGAPLINEGGQLQFSNGGADPIKLVMEECGARHAFSIVDASSGDALQLSSDCRPLFTSNKKEGSTFYLMCDVEKQGSSDVYLYNIEHGMYVAASQNEYDPDGAAVWWGMHERKAICTEVHGEVTTKNGVSASSLSAPNKERGGEVKTAEEYQLVDYTTGHRLERLVAGTLSTRPVSDGSEGLLRTRFLPLREGVATQGGAKREHVHFGDTCVVRCRVVHEAGGKGEVVSLGYDTTKGYARDYTTFESDIHLIVRPLTLADGERVCEGDAFVLVSLSGHFISVSESGELTSSTTSLSSATVWKVEPLSDADKVKGGQTAAVEEAEERDEVRLLSSTPDRVPFSTHEGVELTLTLSQPPKGKGKMVARFSYKGDALDFELQRKSKGGGGGGGAVEYGLSLPRFSAPGLLSIACVHVVKRESGKSESMQLGGYSRLAIIRDDVVMAVNCGGDTFTSSDGIEYDGEVDGEGNDNPSFCVGNRRMSPYTTSLDYQCITRTDDGYLYATARYGSGDSYEGFHAFTYVLPIAAGDYYLTLRFSELSTGLSDEGKRVQKVEVDGEVVVPMVDIGKNVGAYAAFDQVVPIRVKRSPVRVRIVPVAIGSIWNGALLSGLVVSKSMVPLASDVIAASVFKRPENMMQLAKAKSVKQLDVKEVEENAEQRSVRELAFSQLGSIVRVMESPELDNVDYTENLLKNGNCEEGNMSDWEVTGAGGDGWSTVDGFHQTPSCFVTSFGWCSRRQVIDLPSLGFTPAFLDTAPEIKVGEKIAQGTCGGGYYSVSVQLMGGSGEVLAEFATGEKMVTATDFENEEHTFVGYGPGLRQIVFSDAGKDDKFWAGHFGSRLGHAFVVLKKGSAKVSVAPSSANDDEVDRIIAGKIDVTREEMRERRKKKREEGGGGEGGADADVDVSVPNDVFGGKKQSEVEKMKAVYAKRRRALHSFTQTRDVRLFVSSTFRDFMMERDVLAKKTFPELRKFCRNIGVSFNEVDLRWGITAEESGSGKVISICLREIDKSRPFFAAMLGDRYGWSCKEGQTDDALKATFDQAVSENPNYAWVDKYRNRSVTELEILHGCLNNPEQSPHAFFCFRSLPASFVSELDEKDRGNFESESDWHKARQEELKDAIRTSGKDVIEYGHPDEIEDLFESKMKQAILKEVPETRPLTSEEADRLPHEAFVMMRSRNILERPEVFSTLDQHASVLFEHGQATEVTKPLVVTGGSGSGKSTTTANWMLKVVQRLLTEEEESKKAGKPIDDVFVFVHVVGATGKSMKTDNFVRRLLVEMRSFFNMPDDVPNEPDRCIEVLPVFLHTAATRGKVLIVLDGVEELDDQSFKWLPSALPPNIVIVMSAGAGATLKLLQNRGCETYNIQDLTEKEKEEMINFYLGRYSKKLNEEQMSLLIASPSCGSPLYLTSVLEEIRIAGRYEQLTEQIKDYLTANTISELFDKVLARMEKDYISTRDDGSEVSLVQILMEYLFCSRKGLSEDEIMELCPCTREEWSDAFIAVEEIVTARGGMLNIFHDKLRVAVKNRYMSKEKEKQRREELVAHFAQMENGRRKLEELPFQLKCLDDKKELKEVIADLTSLPTFMNDSELRFDLIGYWSDFGFSSASAAYEKRLQLYEHPKNGEQPPTFEELSTAMESLASLYREIGLNSKAEVTLRKIIKLHRRRQRGRRAVLAEVAFNVKTSGKGDDISVCDLYEVARQNEVGIACVKQKSEEKADEAKQVFSEAVEKQLKYLEIPEKVLLMATLNGVGAYLVEKSEFAEAIFRFRKAIELAVQVFGLNHAAVAKSYSNYGRLLFREGQLDKAKEFFVKELEILHRVYGTTHPDISVALNNLALIELKRGHSTNSFKLLNAAVDVLKNTFGEKHEDFGMVMLNLGIAKILDGDKEGAKGDLSIAAEVLKTTYGEDNVNTKKAMAGLQLAS